MAGTGERLNEREVVQAALADARHRLAAAQERGAGRVELRLLAERVEALRRQLDAWQRRAG